MRAATVVQVLQDLFYVLLQVLFYLWSCDGSLSVTVGHNTVTRDVNYEFLSLQNFSPTVIKFTLARHPDPPRHQNQHRYPSTSVDDT